MQCQQDHRWRVRSQGGQSPRMARGRVRGGRPWRTFPGSASGAQERTRWAGAALVHTGLPSRRPEGRGAGVNCAGAGICDQHPGTVGSSPDPGLIGIGQATGRDFWGLSATPRSTTGSRTGLPVPLMPDLMGPPGSDLGGPFSESYLPPMGALCVLWALTQRPPHSAPGCHLLGWLCSCSHSLEVLDS